MKLSNQVITWEQAKKLKDLGVIQVSCFAYSETGKLWAPYYDDMPKVYTNYAAAFTVAELGVMLPDYVDSYRCTTNSADSAQWFADMQDLRGTDVERPFAPTEAQARAKLLIDLMEAGLITAAEVNELLQNA